MKLHLPPEMIFDIKAEALRRDLSVGEVAFERMAGAVRLIRRGS